MAKRRKLVAIVKPAVKVAAEQIQEFMEEYAEEVYSDTGDARLLAAYRRKPVSYIVDYFPSRSYQGWTASAEWFDFDPLPSITVTQWGDGEDEFTVQVYIDYGEGEHHILLDEVGTARDAVQWLHQAPELVESFYYEG